ncbi:MAG TPA: hypothetical protein VKU41_00695 [Polyangiaceae bacterium]|nr:hypothetical protein [Polyangiaceae bacterium]
MFLPSIAAGAPATSPNSPPATAPTTPTPAPPGSSNPKDEARMHFAAGVNLLEDPEKPRYEEAYAEFKRAYEIAKSPNILGNMGLCAMKLERDAEAIDAYSRYLAEVQGLTPAERAQIERDVLTLRAGLARVTVETHPDGALIYDTRVAVRGGSVTNVYGPIQGKTELGLRQGHHILKARYGDGVEVSWESDMAGGESHVFEKPAEKSVQGAAAITVRPVPTGFYIGVIATGALAAGAAVTGVAALATHSRYDTENDGSNPTHATDLRSTGQTLNIASDALLGAALIGTLVTTYLYVSRGSVQVVRSSPTMGTLFTPGGFAGRF